MNITHLRERILVQRRAYISDRMGGYNLSWADGGEFWAAITPMAGGAEQSDESKNLSLLRYRLQWRVGTKVPSTSRLSWRGKYLRFLTKPVEDVQRRFVSAVAITEVDHE